MTKNVIITGATSGIGLETVKIFLNNNYQVIATGRNLEKLNHLKELGAIVHKLDVTNQSDIDIFIDFIKTKDIIPYILINNAGYGQFGTIEETSDEIARNQFNTNLFGLASLTRKIIPIMRQNKSGRIINVSSIAGRVSIPGGGWYAASKHALEAISDAMRWELHQFNIKVSVIQPGPIKTKFANSAQENMVESKADSPYGNLIKNLLETGSNSTGGKADDCAKVIFKAAKSINPKTRYLVTKEAFLINLITTILPQKMIDYFVRMYLVKF